MPTNADVQKLTDALAKIDADTTAIGTAVTAIQTRIQALLDQIAANPSAADVANLATQASAEADKLDPLVAQLNATGTPTP